MNEREKIGYYSTAAVSLKPLPTSKLRLCLFDSI